MSGGPTLGQQSFPERHTQLWLENPRSLLYFQDGAAVPENAVSFANRCVERRRRRAALARDESRPTLRGHDGARRRKARGDILRG
jgi:hypothetical protein